MKTVAVILARGGSKGVVNKNIRLLSGEPLVYYAISAAKYSDVDEVWVSTDSAYIKTISKTYGANVLDRPSKISKDTSPSEEALFHFAENVVFDRLVFIQPTSPLLQPDDINKGLELLEKYDSVFSVYKEHWLPRWSLSRKPLNFQNRNRPRRQDKKSCYVENGAFYMTTKRLLLESECRISGDIGVYEMLPQGSVQIDEENDFSYVEKLL